MKWPVVAAAVAAVIVSRAAAMWISVWALMFDTGEKIFLNFASPA